MFYNRKAFEGGEPHRLMGRVPTPSDDTDGMEITTVKLRANAPDGMVVMMNSTDKNFLFYSLSDVLRSIGLK